MFSVVLMSERLTWCCSDVHLIQCHDTIRRVFRPGGAVGFRSRRAGPSARSQVGYYLLSLLSRCQRSSTSQNPRPALDVGFLKRRHRLEYLLDVGEVPISAGNQLVDDDVLHGQHWNGSRFRDRLHLDAGAAKRFLLISSAGNQEVDRAGARNASPRNRSPAGSARWTDQPAAVRADSRASSPGPVSASSRSTSSVCRGERR